MLPDALSSLRSSLLSVEGEPDPAETAGMVAPRQAAVLLVLFPRGNQVSFLLTARPDTLSRHPGQISLPGGAVEPRDSALWHTALRETQEELGMRTGRLRLLGRLEAVPVVVSNYLITPFVGWNPVPPRLRPDPREVAEVIEVPLDILLDPSAVREELWELRGGYWIVSFYRFGDKSVWGATARILSSLARRLRPTEAGADYLPGSMRPA